MDASIADFLKIERQIIALKKKTRELRKEQDDLSGCIIPILEKIPHKRFEVSHSGDELHTYGPKSYITLVNRKRKEYLSQKRLSHILRDYYTQVFPNRSELDIANFGSNTVKYLWSHRKVMRTSIEVRRVFMRKRKATSMEET